MALVEERRDGEHYELSEESSSTVRVCVAVTDETEATEPFMIENN